MQLSSVLGLSICWRKCHNRRAGDLLFTPLFSPLALSLPHQNVTGPPCANGLLQAGDVLHAVACCKCCTVLFIVFFNQQIVIYAYAKKTKTNKLYQNC